VDDLVDIEDVEFETVESGLVDVLQAEQDQRGRTIRSHAEFEMRFIVEVVCSVPGSSSSIKCDVSGIEVYLS